MLASHLAGNSQCALSWYISRKTTTEKMTKIAIAKNSIPLSVLSNRGRSVRPNPKSRIDAVRDKDGLTAFKAEKLVFAVFRCRASSDEVHLRLAEPTEHPSFRCEISHRDWRQIEVSFRSPIIAFQFTYWRGLLVIGLPDSRILGFAWFAISELHEILIAPRTQMAHFGLINNCQLDCQQLSTRLSTCFKELSR